ncbi:Thioredoxin-like protein [Glarea lozoyensis ATCC 20868]|uniref:Thioredoxin-like protein n=1 Tax=Glarea lozoyensis (strain ATCC 20868 / MF5171) TaxID=1116229 RepID=S3DGG0_GLAL2|nr:Thioredoxin-like protein [Glarea lozoyensis ATCC 20868]EPE31116.1 Thioredoxin-like protein [Glarea lozoyensis ATCC 20868]
MAPKITLYTSYACPWAHRSQIALRELKLAFQTEIIDLKVPRTAEYLAINPRGLVPALVYNDEVLTESAIVSQFLVDAHPSHLEKTSSEPGGALQRARINFFVDTYFSKINSLSYPALKAARGEEKEKAAKTLGDAIVKEIEPLLKDAGPFFGGSERLTLAEVQTASFVIRLLSFGKVDILLPPSFLPALEKDAPNFWKWANALTKEESVTYIWDEKKVTEGTITRLGLNKQV